MNNRFLKLVMALPVLLSATIFAANGDNTVESVRKSIECDALKCQPCQADPCNPCCRLMPGYNAPARPELNCSWDWFVTGSFIYWQAMEEDLEVGNQLSTFTAGAPVTIQTLNFKNKYKPGFKVALGAKFGYDNWDLFAEYTWYHTNHMTTTYNASGLGIGLPAAFTGSTGPIILNDVNIDGFTSTTHAYNKLSRNWRLKLDFIDLMLARSYYVGKKLTMRPAFGARAAYIRQSNTLNGTSNDVFASITSATSGIITQFGRDTTSSSNIVSWGYGLRAYLDADWILGAGFRMLGNGAFDLLYTRYNLVTTFSTQNSPTGGFTSFQRHIDFLRPHAELEWGFGWEDCFCNGRWYIDLEAAYGFQVFWDQNMFLEATSSSLPADELLLHGLRFTARVDF